MVHCQAPGVGVLQIGRELRLEIVPTPPSRTYFRRGPDGGQRGDVVLEGGPENDGSATQHGHGV